MNNITCGIVCFNKQKIMSLRQHLPEKDELTLAADKYKAMGHPLRLAILTLVGLEECCVCDLANVLNKPVSTVSQHLRTLKMVGILTSRQEGKLVFYSLKNPDLMKSDINSMCNFTDMRETQDSETHVNSIPTVGCS